jgi:RCC1 and BTB domain-containing protein
MPVRSGLSGETVANIRCGYYHTLLLTDTGRVFSFGRNDYGQLGLGHNAQRMFGPHQVEELEGKNVTSISAGCYHSIAVAQSGMLYDFGRHTHGQ